MAMMSFSYDLVWGVGVWRFQGSVNSDADYERYISSLHELDVRMRGRESTAIVVVDRDNPTPNAAWRKRMAEATRTVQSTPLLVFVSESRVARAVVTAISRDSGRLPTRFPFTPPSRRRWSGSRGGGQLSRARSTTTSWTRPREPAHSRQRRRLHWAASSTVDSRGHRRDHGASSGARKEALDGGAASLGVLEA